MIESLRGVGYTPETAIADLIDNSISAHARNVWLTFWWEGRRSHIAVLDDGDGMTEGELSAAMRPGSMSPLESRPAEDLGRFGLGLKTASFSQCRQLTVASLRNGQFSTRRWDLDHVARVEDWQLLKGPVAGSEEVLKPLLKLGQGTMVLWEGLDRVVGNVSVSDSSAQDRFLSLIDRIESHLGMVFHRFLEGGSAKLSLFINGCDEVHRVKAWDPFMKDHSATIATPKEPIPTPLGAVEVQGFVLPHKDKLKEREFETGSGLEGWTAQQGFYVYRNRRMLVSGGWLGLGQTRAWTREEPYKLARLRLDIPNTADADWDIDIKKSVARAPSYIAIRLRDLAKHVRDQARQVFAHRGSYGPRGSTPDLQRAWRVVQRKDSVAYLVDRSHPLVKQVLDQAGPLKEAVGAMLRLLEETMPVQRVWIDTMEHGEVHKGAFEDTPSADIQVVLDVLYRHLIETVGLDSRSARCRLLTIEPFHNYPELVKALE
ncbi:MAG: ATP-binding protein [Acidobacteriia bacterium]|nr:ATP-binding protein [Terriglobia bacterium]